MERCNIISEPLLLLPSVAICGRIMTRMTRAWPRPKQHCLARGMSRDASAFLPLLHPPPFDDDLMLPCVHIGRSHILLEAKIKESPCTTFDCEPLKSWVYGRRMRIAPQNNDASGRSGGRFTHRSNGAAAKLKMTTALLPRGAAAPLIRRRRMIPAAFCSMDSVSVSAPLLAFFFLSFPRGGRDLKGIRNAAITSRGMNGKSL